MKLSEIKSILEGNYKLLENLELEIETYKKTNPKTIKNIYLIEDVSFEMDIQKVKTLCEGFLNGLLTNSLVEYISDSLLLSENVAKNDNVFSALELLTDPEVNGEINKQSVSELLNSIA